ncbi:hypothetical protein [Leifsonia poae]|uniref:hypothetical protein n=1 Tax=Leifsonia poae TaxID=110933 RepID=UPI001CC12E6B|nr:hypothetical protein [Leifsonia poae]
MIVTKSAPQGAIRGGKRSRHASERGRHIDDDRGMAKSPIKIHKIYEISTKKQDFQSKSSVVPTKVNAEPIIVDVLGAP